jgi:hypothetical protein
MERHGEEYRPLVAENMDPVGHMRCKLAEVRDLASIVDFADKVPFHKGLFVLKDSLFVMLHPCFDSLVVVLGESFRRPDNAENHIRSGPGIVGIAHIEVRVAMLEDVHWNIARFLFVVGYLVVFVVGHMSVLVRHAESFSVVMSYPWYFAVVVLRIPLLRQRVFWAFQSKPVQTQDWKAMVVVLAGGNLLAQKVPMLLNTPSFAHSL